jgi:hypothetical protein
VSHSSVYPRALCGLALSGLLLAVPPAGAQGSAARAAIDHVERHKRQLGLTGSDVAELAVSSEVASAHNGVTHVYLQQRHRGIDVENAIVNVNVGGDGTVLGVGSRFVPRIAAAAGRQVARITPAQAAASAARHLGLRQAAPFEVLRRPGGPPQATVLSGGGVASRPIEAKLVWLPRDAGVDLAWRVEIEEPGGNHVWHSYIDAETSAALAHVDLVIHDSALATAAAIARPEAAAPEPVPFEDVDGSAYRVFAYPFESPSDGDRTLVMGAADPASSPFGWHDTDGSAGPEFTVTRGNNAHAYTDLDANGIPDPGSDPDGGPSLQFDFPLDLALEPSTYRPFAVTNLFYWNNVMHDVTARYGFDEAAGNFQVTNYSGAPGGGDDVRAEAQDGSGTNNANFLTPTQNAANPRPRMQMFIWLSTPLFQINSPGSIAGTYPAGSASFGAPLDTTGITGDVALVNDGSAAPTLGCGALVGFPAGAVALVDRGGCEFGVKVLNAENAGAVAAIVANNAGDGVINMGPGAVGNQVTISSVFVGQSTGQAMKDALPGGPVNVTMKKALPDRDSDLDAGVIAHEYGHGISNRLTGGPNVNCLSGQEQMGEGWSDWFALNLTTHPADRPTTSRGVGTYVIFEPPDGGGIRPTPYTTDMSVNPSTYASLLDTVNISTPHGVGYVWNTMLWEMYWNLWDRYGYNANIYDAWNTGGNNRALQFVMDGLKFQPCAPGFEDGRNAILAADQALTGGANACEIWRAFAKRGLGFSADQGSSASRVDGTEAFDLPAACTAATFGGFEPPIEAPPAVNVWTAGDVVPVKFTLSGGLPLLDSQPVDCDTLVPTGDAPSALASPGSTGLSRHRNRFHINWLTDASWAGTCRRLTARIAAPADAVAYFRFE